MSYATYPTYAFAGENLQKLVGTGLQHPEATTRAAPSARAEHIPTPPREVRDVGKPAAAA
jgi:hypothetical protein